MRVAACLSILVVLAACSSAPPPAPLPIDRVRASFPAHGIANVIEIEALTRLPLRQARLIAPDGKATPANRLEAHPAQSLAAYQWTANHPYTGMLSGFGAAEPSVPLAASAAPQSQSRLLAVISTASIPLPDPVAYRRDWRRYRIRLVFGSPPGLVETKEIAAPAPAPAASPG